MPDNTLGYRDKLYEDAFYKLSIALSGIMMLCLYESTQGNTARREELDEFYDSIDRIMRAILAYDRLDRAVETTGERFEYLTKTLGEQE